jgi:hypothetical protein
MYQVAVAVVVVEIETARQELTFFSALEIPQSVSAEKFRQPKIYHIKLLESILIY